MTSVAQTGIYYGFARVHQSSATPVELGAQGIDTHPMVMSLGWNPFYHNTKMTAEVHVIHQFDNDFYDHEISVLVLGYIRPELNYTSRDALIEDIATDIRVTLNSLARPAYQKYINEVEWCRPRDPVSTLPVANGSA